MRFRAPNLMIFDPGCQIISHVHVIADQREAKFRFEDRT